VAAPGQQARKRAARSPAASLQPAGSLPVAQVAVDVSLPHLDRPFEYLVPESLADTATPGCRVRVRFAGRLTGGFLLQRTAESEHQGRLGYLERVVSPEPVVTPEIAGLARAVADRYGGTLADVLRLAIPPRHAGAEAARPPAAPAPPATIPAPAAAAATPPPTAPAATAAPAAPAATPQATSPVPAAAATAPRPTATDSPGAGRAQTPAGTGEPSLSALAPSPAAAADAAAQLGPGQPADPEAQAPPAAGSPGGSAGSCDAAARPGDIGAAARDIAAPAARPDGPPSPGTWARYAAGESFLAALAAGRSPRAVWSALPGAGWPAEIATAAAAAASGGRGVVIVVPDARDLDRVDGALAAELGPAAHVILSASLGPAERYRRWLAAERGQVRVVAGTRSAMFAPVADLGLVVLWDEGDDLLAEPRAPYPHAREVLALRAHRAGAAALIGGFARTAEAAQLVTGGWARSLAAARATVRRWAPAVRTAGEDSELARDEAARSARLPGLALRTAREALGRGPVLFQVPRSGYLAAVACERCHAQVRCRCGGPAQLAGERAVPRCGWCGSAVSRSCTQCGHGRLRALVTGATRTAEELGRAFPAVPVRTSGGSRVLAGVPGSPAVVVATPGAEPYADGGYAAAILLDAWALLSRPSLRAAEETLRRWMNAAALVRPGPDGGSVVVVADAALPVVQALIRWDPATFADRELAERRELRFPPAARMAALSGPHSAVRALLDAAELPPGAEILGPVPVAGGDPGPVSGAAGSPDGGPGPDADAVRFLVRAPRSGGTALAAVLHAGQAARTARKEPGTVRLELDPAELI
jgi:primosomal protein N' (replication factor Y) (superfamily II helicase)